MEDNIFMKSREMWSDEAVSYRKEHFMCTNRINGYLGHKICNCIGLGIFY